MLDRSERCKSARESEASVPVVSVKGQEDRVVVRAMWPWTRRAGLSVSLVGLCGEDEHACAAACVRSGRRWNDAVPGRNDRAVVLSRNQQLLRMDFEESLATHANDLFGRYARTNTRRVPTWLCSVTMRAISGASSHCWSTAASLTSQR